MMFRHLASTSIRPVARAFMPTVLHFRLGSLPSPQSILFWTWVEPLWGTDSATQSDQFPKHYVEILHFAWVSPEIAIGGCRHSYDKMSSGFRFFKCATSDWPDSDIDILKMRIVVYTTYLIDLELFKWTHSLLHTSIEFNRRLETFERT